MKPTRPRLDTAVVKPLRRFLSNMGYHNQKFREAVLRSSPSTMLERLNGNPLKLWDAAWQVDVWAVQQRRLGKSDGGAYDLASVMYDHAARHDTSGLIKDGDRSWRWRDVHDQPEPYGPHKPWDGLQGTTRPPLCGCYECQWERPHAPREKTT